MALGTAALSSFLCTSSSSSSSLCSTLAGIVCVACQLPLVSPVPQCAAAVAVPGVAGACDVAAEQLVVRLLFCSKKVVERERLELERRVPHACTSGEKLVVGLLCQSQTVERG